MTEQHESIAKKSLTEIARSLYEGSEPPNIDQLKEAIEEHAQKNPSDSLILTNVSANIQSAKKQEPKVPKEVVQKPDGSYIVSNKK